MTRSEEIRQAGIEYTYRNRPMCIGGGAFSEMIDKMNRNYAFEEGAQWADEHPNLYNDEKYHTVKVSCLDELNRKAELYDVFLDKASVRSLYTPSITLHSYPNSGYRLSFEICMFGYTYRKGLFRIKDREIQPTDNTNGFVSSDWFLQFRNPETNDFLKDLYDLINKFKKK